MPDQSAPGQFDKEPGMKDPKINPTPESGGEIEEIEASEEKERFRALSEPIIGRFYPEGQIPFGISHEEAMRHVPDRILEKVRQEGVNVDMEFLQDVQSVLDPINAVGKNNFSLGVTSVTVIEYHLRSARGIDPGIDIGSVAFLKGEMEKAYKKQTGRTLSQWAVEYVKTHQEGADNLESAAALFKVYDQDFDGFRYTVSNLARIISLYAREMGMIDINAVKVMPILHKWGFLVPAEWRDEYSSTEDGKTLLSAIEKARRKLQEEDLADALSVSLETRSADELRLTPFTANDVLAMASFDNDVPENWNDCDAEVKRSVINAMKVAAEHLGAIVADTEEGPVITFPKE